eukprot:COSAG01_NODE_5254_length_4380_cov_3.719823_1_plen_119_part_00
MSKNHTLYLLARSLTRIACVFAALDGITQRSLLNCAMCKKPLGTDCVHDHCHMTGNYRGACHSKCNLEEGKRRTKNYLRQEHRQSESRRAARAKKATQPQYMTPDQIYQQLMAGPSRH